MQPLQQSPLAWPIEPLPDSPFATCADSIRARSPFLLTSILCVASLFKRPAFSSDSSEAFSQCGLTHAQLSVHALDLAMGCFADGRSSLEAVQAFYLLSTWKDIDDSSSYLRMGFASKLSLDLELSSMAPVGVEQSREEGLWWRARQRMAMALFVQVRLSPSPAPSSCSRPGLIEPGPPSQDRVQGYSFYRTHTLPLNDPLISGWCVPLQRPRCPAHVLTHCRPPLPFFAA